VDAAPPAPRRDTAGGGLKPGLLVVDAANVVGSVPDGWWRDRVGANTRLRDRLTGIAAAGHADLPAPVEVALVVEGQARAVADTAGVRVIRAPGSGDDTIVELVRTEGAGRRCVVVTADQGLRSRVEALGAELRGPRWLR
jgi:hypothetical protein